MKKKLFRTAALVLALAMMFGANAFALRSISIYDPSINLEALEKFPRMMRGIWLETLDGETNEDWYITVEPTTIEWYDDAIEACAEMQALQEMVPEGYKWVIKCMFDIKSHNVPEEIMSKGVKVTMQVDGIKSNQLYPVLHFSNKATDWELIETTVNSDLTISGVFKDFSPVAILELQAEGGSGSGSGSTGGSGNVGGTVESPKTGQTSDMGVILTMTALCGLTAISLKKAKRV